MTEISSSKRQARLVQKLTLGALLFFVFLLLVRVLMVPDPGGKLLWVRAQNLEERGLMQQALRQYQLLAQTHPQSPYAPAALLHCGDLLRDLARAGESGRVSQALDFYQQLAARYPLHRLAGDALLRSGELYLRDLKVLPRARSTYQEILREYPNNAPLAAEATLRLGEVAQIARDGQAARTQFQQVLRLYPKETERSAEAQYRLGETYETLFKDEDRRIWARNAYEATIRNYPGSAWAGKAKERLGILVWGETAPRERRVLIKTEALPDEGKTTTLLQALRMVLGARGITTDATVLRGWSLEPFYTGFAPDNPARVLTPSFMGWKNVVSNAGLVYRVYDGGPSDDALQDLQHELDDAHATLVYTGQWQFAAGYDSLRDEVLLQSGGEVKPLRVTDFVKDWARRSEFGEYSLLSFHTPAEMPQSERGARNASTQATPKPQTTPTPRPQLSPLSTPTYVMKLEKLSETETHRRAIKRAALWMQRPRDEAGNLLNIAALEALAGELRNVATAREAAPEEITVEELPVRAEQFPNNPTPTDAPPAETPVPNPTPELFETPAPTEATPLAPTPNATPQGTPAPAKTPLPAPSPATRARALLAWKGAPALRWITMRRYAAAYLDIASARLKSPSLKQAADEFRASANAMQNAVRLLPVTVGAGELSNNSRRALENAATEIEKARDAERRATELMIAI